MKRRDKYHPASPEGNKATSVRRLSNIPVIRIPEQPSEAETEAFLSMLAAFQHKAGLKVPSRDGEVPGKPLPPISSGETPASERIGNNIVEITNLVDRNGQSMFGFVDNIQHFASKPKALIERTFDRLAADHKVSIDDAKLKAAMTLGDFKDMIRDWTVEIATSPMTRLVERDRNLGPEKSRAGKRQNLRRCGPKNLN
jgi:hypothetical protein